MKNSVEDWLNKELTMKTRNLTCILIITALCGTYAAPGQDIDAMAPVVVKTVPEAGLKDVAPGEVEIKVTFSKVMTDNSWSWSSAWLNSEPEGIGKPRYESNGKTCVLKVKLQPGKTYGYWINSSTFHGFKDRQGKSAIPYLLTFKTRE